MTYAPVSGSASPSNVVFYETSDIPLADIMQLYYRDPTCKSSVDLLAASTVGMGFYTTVDEKYDKAAEAKAAVDKFCEDVNLDTLLNDMAKPLIACGNDFWLKLSPSRLSDLLRLPIDAVWHVELDNVDGFRIPHHATSYRLRALYAPAMADQKGQVLDLDAVIHWQLNPYDSCRFWLWTLAGAFTHFISEQ